MKINNFLDYIASDGSVKEEEKTASDVSEVSRDQAMHQHLVGFGFMNELQKIAAYGSPGKGFNPTGKKSKVASGALNAMGIPTNEHQSVRGGTKFKSIKNPSGDGGIDPKNSNKSLGVLSYYLKKSGKSSSEPHMSNNAKDTVREHVLKGSQF